MSGSRRVPDRRSPLTLDVHELVGRPGAMRQVRLTAQAPAGLRVGMIGVAEGAEVVLDLRAESAVEGVLITGSAHTRLLGECSRCLAPIEAERRFGVQEMFFFPGRAEDDDDPEVVEELIDLEIPLREAVVLDLPFSPLCRDDCAGLCDRCGANLNDHPDHEHGPDADPRWAKLAELSGRSTSDEGGEHGRS